MKTLQLIGLLIIVAAGLASAISHLRTFELDISPLPPDAKSVAALLENTHDGTTDGASFAGLTFPSTTERPLFSRNRRKFVPPPPPKPVQPAKPVQTAKVAPQKKPSKPVRKPAQIQLKLIGISISDSEASALFANKDGTNQWVTSGDRIQSWEVSQIDNNSVHLTGDGRNIHLQLYKSREP